MSLYLVQHGKSLPKDVDPEQGLSREGIDDVKRIAELAKGYNVKVSRINHSTKKRARQTAEIFQEALNPLEPIQEIEGIKPMDDVAVIAEGLAGSTDIMIVGHLPFMERMASYLITGAIEKRVFKFQNGGIVCLDREPETGDWFIKWALMPRVGEEV